MHDPLHPGLAHATQQQGEISDIAAQYGHSLSWCPPKYIDKKFTVREEIEHGHLMARLE
jgi:hypothetical protein